jgi:tRNA(His) 5'-end guanylyltransferase
MNKNKKDSLGDRMKEFYEKRSKILLPRRTYTVIRVDGKAFHTYTKGLNRPFDIKFIEDMDETAKYMCENIQGAKLAFVQSDEISIIVTDFDNLKTNAWFDGNIQKMASISASLATAKLNELRPGKIALFDSRVFTIPSLGEIDNYLIWRQQDTTRNSISSLAQSMFSPKDLHGCNCDKMQDMCFLGGVNWNDLDAKLKRGRLIVKESYDKNGAVRTRWNSIAPPIFTQDKTVVEDLLPKLA